MVLGIKLCRISGCSIETFWLGAAARGVQRTSDMTHPDGRRLRASAPCRADRWSLAALLAAVVLIASAGAGVAKDRVSIYAYRDTKTLVSLVEGAAALMQRDGEAAFKQFAQQD